MSESKYRYLTAELREDIRKGLYAAGRAFPSEAQLVRRFAVSRQTVQSALRELERAGYIVRSQGRGTRVVFGRGRRLGLIPCVPCSEFFAPVAARLSQRCQDAGSALLLATAAPDADALRDPAAYARRVERIAHDFVDQKVAGVLFQPIAFLPDAAQVNAHILSVFDAARIPVVLLDYDIVPAPERSAYDVVGIDNVEAGAALAAHLVERGARNVHVLMRPNCSNAVRNRMRGVALGLQLAGRPWDERHVLASEPDDIHVVRAHLARGPRPDAVVCGYDGMALAFEKTLNRLGLTVPDDLLLAGVDDREFAQALGLTTVHQPLEDIADAAFDRLKRRIEHPDLPAQAIYLSAPIVVRQSTKRISRKGKRTWCAKESLAELVE